MNSQLLAAHYTVDILCTQMLYFFFSLSAIKKYHRLIEFLHVNGLSDPIFERKQSFPVECLAEVMFL